ncbi:MAG: hypothetical protein ACJ77K_08825 [Bacteroidia bacterium]
MKYPEIALQAFLNSVRDDESAYDWLAESKWKELAAVDDALYAVDNSGAIDYLMKNRSEFPTAFCFWAALCKNQEAFDELMKNDREWAAVVNAAHRSEEAYDWLIGNNFPLHAKIAEALLDNTPVHKPSTLMF